MNELEYAKFQDWLIAFLRQEPGEKSKIPESRHRFALRFPDSANSAFDRVLIELEKAGRLAISPEGDLRAVDVIARPRESKEARKIRLQAQLDPDSQAAVRLLEELSLEDLRRAVDANGTENYNAIRAALRKHSDYEHPTKFDLAVAIIELNREGFLSEKGLREDLAWLKTIEAPKKWTEGGPAAIRFVAELGLPSIFAGEKRRDPHDPYQVFDPIEIGTVPEDYQDELIRKIEALYHSRNEHRAIISLPTGAGKTRVAAEAIFRLINSATERNLRIAWISHTDELNSQASGAFEQVLRRGLNQRSVVLVRAWKYDEYSSQEFKDLIPKSSSITILGGTKFRNRLRDTFGNEVAVSQILRETDILFVDEAHRTGAPTYKEVIQHLEAVRGAEACHLKVVGLTATPMAGLQGINEEEKTRALSDLFDRRLIVPSETLGAPETHTAKLVTRGVLARLTPAPVIETGQYTVEMPLSSSEDEGSVVNQETEMLKGLDVHRRREQILPRLLELAADPNRLTLYFGPTVNDATMIALLLRMQGVPAAVVSANTRTKVRRQIIGQFRRREIRVLANCEVLTAGFDCPEITDLVIGRPTLSRVLFQQMLGRGLRGKAFGGTETCALHYCKDDFRDRRTGKANVLPTMVWEEVLQRWGRLTLEMPEESQRPEAVGERTTTSSGLKLVPAPSSVDNEKTPQTRQLQVPAISVLLRLCRTIPPHVWFDASQKVGRIDGAAQMKKLPRLLKENQALEVHLLASAMTTFLKAYPDYFEGDLKKELKSALQALSEQTPKAA